MLELGPWSLTTGEMTDSHTSYLNNGVEVGAGTNTIKVGQLIAKSGVRTARPHHTPTDYSYSLTEGSGVPHKSQGLYSGGNTTSRIGYQALIQLLTLSSVSSANVVKAAGRAKLAKANEPIFNGLTFAAEFSESVGMFKEYSNRLVSGHNKAAATVQKNIRKMRGSSLKMKVKNVAQEYIAYQFGVAPLINDVNDLNNALLAKAHGRRPEHTQDSFAVSATSTKSYTNPAPFVSGVTSDVIQVDKVLRIYKCGGTVVASPRDPMNNQDLFGFRAQDVLPSVVEIIPYSWAVGYFSNIDQIVGALSQTAVTYESGWEIEITELSRDCIAKARSTYVDASGTDGSSHFRQFTFVRRPSSLQVYYPDFEFKSPNLSQVANLAAVAAQRIIPNDKDVYTTFLPEKMRPEFARDVVSELKSLQSQSRIDFRGLGRLKP